MFWPPKFLSNNHVVIADTKQFNVHSTRRFDSFTQAACVLSPWLARSDQDTLWPANDPMLRLMLIGEPVSLLRSVNADTIGSIIQLGSVDAGIQLWEVVSYFDWYLDDDAGKVGSVAWCRLYVPPPTPPPIVGGASPFSPTLIEPGVDNVLSAPPGTTSWFYAPLDSPDGYTIDVADLPGTASVSTYGGPPGSLTADIPPAGNGSTTQTTPSSVGPVRYISITGDPTVLGTPTFRVTPSTPSWVEGGATAGTAVAISSGVDVPLVVRAGGTVYYTVPLADPTGYTIDVSGLAGSATVSTDGGSPGSLTADIPPAGNGTWSQVAPSSSGPNRYVVLNGDPHIDSTPTFKLTPVIPGGTCATAITLAIGVSTGTMTVSFGADIWFDVPAGATTFQSTITAATGTSNMRVEVYNGICSGLSILTAAENGFGGPFGPFWTSGSATKIKVTLDPDHSGDSCTFHGSFS